MRLLCKKEVQWPGYCVIIAESWLTNPHAINSYDKAVYRTMVWIIIGGLHMDQQNTGRAYHSDTL